MRSDWSRARRNPLAQPTAATIHDQKAPLFAPESAVALCTIDCSSSVAREMAESPCDRTIDTLYEEIKDESGSHFQCSISLRTLSRLQRMESHLTSIHGIGEICYIASHKF